MTNTARYAIKSTETFGDFKVSYWNFTSWIRPTPERLLTLGQAQAELARLNESLKLTSANRVIVDVVLQKEILALKVAQRDALVAKGLTRKEAITIAFGV